MSVLLGEDRSVHETSPVGKVSGSCIGEYALENMFSANKNCRSLILDLRIINRPSRDLKSGSISFADEKRPPTGTLHRYDHRIPEQCISRLLLTFNSGAIFRSLGNSRLQDDRHCWCIVSSPTTPERSCSLNFP